LEDFIEIESSVELVADFVQLPVQTQL